MKSITLKNIGAIESLSLPVPAEGGVVVLRGRNGSGKSTALSAIQTAVTGKGKPPLRDKTAKGEVQAGGVTLTVAKSIRRAGELMVTSLDSRLSVADLVEPGIMDPIRADASRIKALVNLSGATIDPGDLHGFPEELIGGLNLDDPVGAMAELKKRIDIGAREYEKLAKEAASKADALLESAGEPEPLPDEAALQEAFTNAQRRLDRLNDQAQAAIAAQAKAAAARAKLATIETVEVDTLVAQRDAAVFAVEEKRNAAQRLKEQYNAAVDAYKAATGERDLAQTRLESALQSAELRNQLEAQIAESLIPQPTADEIEAARALRESAMEALTHCARTRSRMEARAKALEVQAESEHLDGEALSLRTKARYTEEVLSEIIADLGCPLRCIDGRLVTDTVRGPTFYGDLSEGERWKLALDIAVAAVGKRGLIVVPQSAWEGLDPVNRKLIADHAKASGTVVITAECDDGELTATLEAA